MELRNFATALFVKDIEISKDFYINILKFNIDLDFGTNVMLKNGPTLWQIHDEQIIPVTVGREKISDTSVQRFELYFETENLPDVHEILKNSGVQFLHEIHEEPWGQRTIRFFDPDRHLIEVGESMKHFVMRFYSQGMTFEQVSARTSVPLDEIKRLLQ